MSTAANLPNASGAASSAGSDSNPSVKFDFPTWLPPMLVKELRQGLRTRGFIGSMVGFQLVMVIAFVWAFAANMFGESDALQSVNGFFWGVLGVLLLIVTPIRAMAGLRQEIDTKSLDLLMLTNLTAWRIVLGKWTSLLAQAALLVMALLPYGVVRYFFGSVDLLDDLLGIGMLYLGCGALTALAFWVSGLPKLLRFGLPVALIMVFQSALGGIFFGGNRMMRMFSGASYYPVVAVMIFIGALFMVFCLGRAVRWIAPPSDNLSPLSRGLALGTLVLAPFLALWGTSLQSAAVGLLSVAIVALTFVTILEIWSLQIPMGIHIRRWWKRGRWGAWVGTFVLPGWPSAALFAALWIGLAGCVLIFALSNATVGDHAPQILWVLVLLWVALVFPMVLLSFAPNLGRQAPFVYVILQGAFGVLAVIEANASNDGLYHPFVNFIREIIHVLPVSSFWLQLEHIDSSASRAFDHIVPQIVMIALVALVAGWRMMFYWRWVRSQGALARRKEDVAIGGNPVAAAKE